MTHKYCACRTKRLWTRYETCWNVTKCHACHAKQGFGPRETRLRAVWNLQKGTTFAELTIGATSSEHTLNPQTPRVKREPLLRIRNKKCYSYDLFSLFLVSWDIHLFFCGRNLMNCGFLGPETDWGLKRWAGAGRQILIQWSFLDPWNGRASQNLWMKEIERAGFQDNRINNSLSLSLYIYIHIIFTYTHIIYIYTHNITYVHTICVCIHIIYIYIHDK